MFEMARTKHNYLYHSQNGCGIFRMNTTETLTVSDTHGIVKR